MMGGTLTVESRVGEGACFRFRVLAERDDGSGKMPAIERSVYCGYAGPRRGILLVDDEEINRHVLATLLRENGFAVFEAGGGQAAIAFCDAAFEAGSPRVDLIVTDQFMADGDGWLILQTMAKRHPGLPVVLMSAAPPNRPIGFSEGPDFVAHLLKPLDHCRLLRCIGDILALKWTETLAADVAAPASQHVRLDPADSLELCRMIDNGQMTDIMTWAEDLAARDQRFADIAKAVRIAARHLDFPALKALVEV
jgi:CheY-like chemotaxis protein